MPHIAAGPSSSQISPEGKRAAKDGQRRQKEIRAELLKRAMLLERIVFGYQGFCGRPAKLSVVP